MLGIVNKPKKIEYVQYGEWIFKKQQQQQQQQNPAPISAYLHYMDSIIWTADWL